MASLLLLQIVNRHILTTMKAVLRLLPLLVLSFFSLQTAAAQEGLSLGLQVAPTVNLAREFVDDRSIDSLKPGATIGVQAGVQGHYGYTDNIGVYSGAFYRLSPMTIGPVDNKSKVRLSYLEIPLALQFTSYDLGNSWYLKARLGMSTDINLGAIQDNGDERIKVGDQFRGIDFGLMAYIGMEYDLLEAGYLDFGVGYRHGLVNIYKDDATIHGYAAGKDVEMRLSRLAFNVGFIFR